MLVTSFSRVENMSDDDYYYIAINMFTIVNASLDMKHIEISSPLSIFVDQYVILMEA